MIHPYPSSPVVDSLNAPDSASGNGVQVHLRAAGSDSDRVRVPGTLVFTADADDDFTCMAMSPDGALLAAGMENCGLYVWGTAKGDVVHKLGFGHYRDINAFCAASVVFSPDGTRLAAYDVRTVRVLDVATGEVLHKLEHTGDCRLSSMVFSPDGTRLASSTWVIDAEDFTVHVWDLTTGEAVYTLKAHAFFIESIAYSPDGACLASCSRDKTVRIWDAATGEALHLLEGHTDDVKWIAYSPDGMRLASCSREDKTVRIWDAATGDLQLTLEGHEAKIRLIVFSPDGARLVSCLGDNTICTWDARTGEVLHSFQGASPGSSNLITYMVFSADGARLASCGGESRVCVWDATTGEALYTFEDQVGGCRSVIFTPDGTRLVACGYRKTIRSWNLTTGAGKALHKLEGHTGEVVSIAYSPDGVRVASCSFDETVRLWDSATGEALHVLEGHTGRVRSVVFSPSGALLASCAWDKTVYLWDPVTGEALHALKGHEKLALSVAFSPDGMCLASGSVDKTIRIWDVATGDTLHTLEGHSAHVASVAYSADGMHLASAGSDGIHLALAGSNDYTVRIWSTATGEMLRTLEGHTENVNLVVFSPDGTHLASGSNDKSVRVWDATNGKLLHKLPHTGHINTMAYSPDGKRLASGSSSTHVWDALTGEALHTFEQFLPNSATLSVVFSPDSTRLASCSSECSVRVWDMATGEALQKLAGHTNIATSVVYSPDGTRLASCSKDMTVRIWELDVCPAMEELLSLWSPEVPECDALLASLTDWPLAVQRRAAEDGDDYAAGETVLHVLARRSDAQRLRVVLASNDNACPLQPGPHGSPLHLAVNARNDECVRVLLDAIVQRCNGGGVAWRFHTEALGELMPLLAQLYSEDLTKALNRIAPPTAPSSSLYVARGCSNVEPMSVDETFHTSARHLQSQRVWLRYFERGDDAEQEALVQRIQRGLGADGRVPGSSGTDVEATVVPVKGIAGPQHAKTPLKQHPIGCLLHAGLADALGSPLINHVLTFKWNRYARGVFLASMRLYMVMLALFTLATVQDECYDVGGGDNWWAWVRVANDVAVLLLALHHLRLEARQVRKENVLVYLASVWNALDVVGLLLIIVLVPFRIFCWEHASTLQSVAAVCLWLKLLDFFRAFRTTGPFVRMVFRIVNAVGFFLLVLTVVLVAFSHGLYLIFRGVDDVAASESGTAFDFGSWWVLVKMYQVMVSGEFDRTELTLARSEGLALAYVVGFSAFATILMLNLLIALMGSVYDEVQQNVENEWLLERAQIVLDIDQYMDESALANEEWFPQWVHVLRGKFAKKAVVQATNNQVEERVRAHVDAKVERVREEVQQVEAKVDKLAAQMALVVEMLQRAQADDGDEAKEEEEEEEEE